MIHVHPVNDLVSHDMDDECVCGPHPVFTDDGIVMVHHALDGRK